MLAVAVHSVSMHYAGIGDQMLLRPHKSSHGYAAMFSIALDLSDTAVGAADSFQLPGGGGTPPPGGPMPS